MIHVQRDENAARPPEKAGKRLCSLCGGFLPALFACDRYRSYLRCPECGIISAEPSSFLSPEEEKARYLQHRNSPVDMGYRTFLNRLARPLGQRLESRSSCGLDFGCGPGPTLSVMLEERGHHMDIYDPYFACNHSLLFSVYDFVTCTETVEHFYFPGKEWRLLLRLVKPGGWLGIMTSMTAEGCSEADFNRWHYKRDPTHVNFFSRKTFMFLARRDGLDIQFHGSDVIILRKPDYSYGNYRADPPACIF